MTTQAEGVPKMTGIHECALQITIAKMIDEGEEDYTGGLREILSLVRSLASGSRDTYDTKTQVVVRFDDAVDLTRRLHVAQDQPSVRGLRGALANAHNIVSRWLSRRTP